MIAIVAVGKEGKIGHDDEMLWNLPDDFQWYKKNTTGNVVLVGRKTYGVLPLVALKNREHWVVSSSKIDFPEGIQAKRFASIESAMNKVRKAEESGKTVFLAGGSMMYHELLKECNEAYVTWVDADYPEANKDFPFMEIIHNFKRTEIVLDGENNGIKFRICKYKRIK